MITLTGDQFIDQDGRSVLLRGVNLGGSSKMPLNPNGATHLSEKFYESRAVSFVGRPFPAPEADEHFQRLRHWGFNCLRFLVTWEAIEHAGPGLYDLVYLDYLQKMVAKAGEYGFFVFIDPHQDVWSRWTGGDGAPAWTLEKVGFQLENLHATGAAFLHQELDEGEPFPTMRWVTNYNKLAAATMFTLFFGGNDFAPATEIDGEPVQDYLQRHYFGALKQVAERLQGMDHVLGYDTLNEPSAGLIGVENLSDTAHALFRQGPSPTPLQGMLAGAGIPQQVDIYAVGLRGEQVVGQRLLNPERLSAWQPGVTPVWQANGVWGDDGEQVRLLRPDHFSQVNGRPVSFAADYMRPFIERFAAEIRAIDPQAIIFAESALGHPLPQLELPNVVNASHWYDAIPLFMRRFTPHLGIDNHSRRPVIGAPNVQNSFRQQLAALKQEGLEAFGGPTLLGEFGIAYDLNEKIGFTERNFGPHTQALDRTFKALEANLLHGTLWNYTADNDNLHGDQWNGEDLSIFSRDQILPLDDPHDLDAGGRALGAFVRPYPRVTAGTPLAISFDLATRHFEFVFRDDPSVSAPTEIFVPDYHYAVGLGVELSDGRVEYDQENQLLRYWPEVPNSPHTIRLFRERGPAEVLTRQIEGGDEAAYPLEHTFVTVNGVTLHTVQAGPKDGKLVVLLHGFPEFWYGWKYQIPDLVRAGYRVVVPDQRGVNLSDKPTAVADYHIDLLAADVAELIETLGYQSAHVIGHDWGALVTWWLAATRPQVVDRAAVLNVPHPQILEEFIRSNPGQALKSWYVGAFQLPWLPEAIATRTDVMAQGLKTSGLPDTFSDEDLDLYRKAWAKPRALEGGINWYRAFARSQPRLTNPKIRLPLLILWGAKDQFLSREMAPASLKLCEAGELIFFEEATHWLQHDEPERVNAYLRRFLADGDAEEG